MENSTVRIFCEGISDQRFLRDFLKVHYNIAISDKELESKKYIHCLGGWTNLSNLKLKITQEFSEYKTLIFLDADDQHTVEKSGLDKTISYIDNLMTSWGWTNYDKFIFPNNNEKEGEVEDLLENVINPKNSDIFECWNSFEDCLAKKDKNYNVPAKKSKIFLYLESLNQKNNCSDRNRDFQDESLWDIKNLENPYILKLKTFLDKHLK